MPKNVENDIRNSNNRYKDLTDLKDENNTEYEHSANPQTIIKILSLLEKGQQQPDGSLFVHAADILHIDHSIRENSQLLLTIKGYDLDRLDAQFHNKRQGEIVTGSVNGYDKSANYGDFSLIDINANIDLLTRSQCKEGALIKNLRLVAPRDWAQFEKKIYIVTHKSLIVYDLETQHVEEVQSQFITDPHAIVIDSSKREIIITATSIDSIVIFDLDTFCLKRWWSAWRHGYNQALGVNNNKCPQNLAHVFKDMPSLEKGFKEKGIALRIYEPNVPPDENELPTSKQACHLNSVLIHPSANVILTVAFGTAKKEKYPENEIRKNSGGKVLAIFPNDEVQEVVSNLANPHNISYLGKYQECNYYCLTHTAKGTLEIYEESVANPLVWCKKGEISFATMKETLYREHQWLQSCSLNNQYLTLVDSSRRGIIVWSLFSDSYTFIQTPNKAAVHKAMLIK